jgi:thiol-disulfide isomerase/thioredoxin
MKLPTKYLFLVLVLCSLQGTAQSIPKWKSSDLSKAIEETKEPTIFNFWATFCAPCIEELPYFQELVAKYKESGVRLVLVNLDMASVYPKIPAFAKRFGIKAPIVFLDETDADLFCPIADPKWSGAIPASLFVNNKSGYRRFYEDQIAKDDLEKEITSLIGR